ncbi:tRNA (uracil-5-)-methyltransferase homolog A-like [Zophobas morio]|uniref:tRNA (uracil-5-)-methyltransferase homolog A-like n=1 Tax=Zophobas morio TaxID=2755281 RepID=UPI003082E569
MKSLALEMKLKKDLMNLKSPIIESPNIWGYRNKCEFACGLNGQVGFYLGRNEDGTVEIVSGKDCPHVSELMKKIALNFQEFLATLPFHGYDSLKEEGHFRQLVLRTSQRGEVMALVQFHPQQLSSEEISEACAAVYNFYQNLCLNERIKLSCGFFQLYSKRTVGIFPDDPIELIYGDSPYIYESLLNLTFRISITSFFQVNVPATEKLYKLIEDWCGLSESSVLLDICCGTGTIGLSLSSKVPKVIGLELVQSAVNDANFNASLNGINNVEFFCGHAEATLPRVLDKYASVSDCVGVVDPPRAGLHPSLIRAFRKSSLKKLIYVSCDYKQAKSNFINLCKEDGGAPPFELKKYCAVDLFPHTHHTELVLLFERN